jgi:hypothetical protein
MLAHNACEVARMVADLNRTRVCFPSCHSQRKGAINNAMNTKTFVIALFCFLLSLPAAFAATHETRIPRSYTAHHSTAHSSSASRPLYGGGHHTKSHGGTYRGSINGHHKKGHYQNWRTGNSYGVHKPH